MSTSTPGAAMFDTGGSFNGEAGGGGAALFDTSGSGEGGYAPVLSAVGPGRSCSPRHSP
jgi:hypothetical protein